METEQMTTDRMIPMIRKHLPYGARFGRDAGTPTNQIIWTEADDGARSVWFGETDDGEWVGETFRCTFAVYLTDENDPTAEYGFGDLVTVEETETALQMVLKEWNA